MKYFATGSGDTTVKIWDIREKKACVSTFQGSDSSINCVKFLPGRLSTLAAGSEDSSIRLYDLRVVKELGNYKKDYSDNNSVNSIGFSKSGIILFASTTENNILSFWNIFGKDIRGRWWLSVATRRNSMPEPSATKPSAA